MISRLIAGLWTARNLRVGITAVTIGFVLAMFLRGKTATALEGWILLVGAVGILVAAIATWKNPSPVSYLIAVVAIAVAAPIAG